MKRSEHEVIAKRIINFYKNRANRNTSQTVQDFVAEGYLQNIISSDQKKRLLIITQSLWFDRRYEEKVD